VSDEYHIRLIVFALVRKQCESFVVVPPVNITNNTTTNDTPKFPAHRDGKFLSLKNAARELSCTRRFLERRIECGELSVFRPSRKLVRVSREELDRWVASYSHGGHLSPTKASIPGTEGSAAP
jgi:excisionase family DNA binding protein